MQLLRPPGELCFRGLSLGRLVQMLLEALILLCRRTMFHVSWLFAMLSGERGSGQQQRPLLPDRATGRAESEHLRLGAH